MPAHASGAPMAHEWLLRMPGLPAQVSGPLGESISIRPGRIAGVAAAGGNRCPSCALLVTTALDLSEPNVVEIGGALFDPPPPMPQVDAEAGALKDHRGLEALRLKVEALDRAEKVEKGDYLPQIVAVAGKETVTTKLAQTDPNWYAGVHASWTLLEGGARRARVSEKASENAQARIELRHAEEQVRLAIRSALLDYESQKSAHGSRPAVPLAAPGRASRMAADLGVLGLLGLAAADRGPKVNRRISATRALQTVAFEPHRNQAKLLNIK